MIWWEQMSAALLQSNYDDRVYGAVTFREADSTTGAFDYTIHVRLIGVAVFVGVKAFRNTSARSSLFVAYRFSRVSTVKVKVVPLTQNHIALSLHV